MKQTLTPRKNFQQTTQTKPVIKKSEDLDLSTHPVRLVVKLPIPQRKATLEQTQQTDRLTRTGDRKDKTKSNREMLKATQMGLFKLQSKL